MFKANISPKPSVIETSTEATGLKEEYRHINIQVIMGLFNLFSKKKEERLNNKEVISPIERVESLADIIALAWNKLDADILAPHLSDNFQYNSAWISNTMRGRDEYIHYLQGKFKTIKSSGDAPNVYVIEENGKMLPHLLQQKLGVESILDFDSIEGKITRMFMRPPIKIIIVDEENWGVYAQTYHDFLPTALQIAGASIQKYISEKGFEFPVFSWLQTQLVHPSFQHLCFRCGNNVYSVLIALHGFQTNEGKEDDSIVVFKRDYDNLLNECRKNNLIPCLIPVCARPHLPLLGYSHIIHAETEEQIYFTKVENRDNVPMSKWEINNMGINVVVQYLTEQGYDNISYCDILEIEPHIWFEKKGKKSYVIVRSIPIGYRKQKFEINKTLLVKLGEYDGYFADVQFTSSSPVLTDDKGNIVPLSKRDGDDDIWMWRGDGFYCNFTGLQPIERAIVDNDFIEVIDKPSYDIK